MADEEEISVAVEAEAGNTGEDAAEGEEPSAGEGGEAPASDAAPEPEPEPEEPPEPKDPLLEPIPGKNPSGKDLQFSGIREEIDEFRKVVLDSEADETYGILPRDAEPREVIRAGLPALEKESKDLWILTRVADAWIQIEGSGALLRAVKLLHGFIEDFWDTVYPALDPDDEYDSGGMRRAPLDWFGSQEGDIRNTTPSYSVQLIPVTAPVKEIGRGYTWQEYKGTSGKPASDDAGGPAITRDEFNAQFAKTPKQFYVQFAADIAETEARLKEFEALCDEKFNEDICEDGPPSFSTLKRGLEQIRVTAQALLDEKRKLEPDIVEEEEGEEGADGEGAAEGGGGSAGMGLEDLLAGAGDGASLKPKSAQEAHVALIIAAQYMRKSSPGSPVSYTMLRGLRWGELRANGEEIDPGVLVAPDVEMRKALRRHAASQSWNDVITTAENAMSRECGRGWLDLQRYVIQAATELGFDAVARAVRSELRALLVDYPRLPYMTLSDDTGTANPDTIEWLRSESLLPE